jgi:hypothetical protein
MFKRRFGRETLFVILFSSCLFVQVQREVPQPAPREDLKYAQSVALAFDEIWEKCQLPPNDMELCMLTVGDATAHEHFFTGDQLAKAGLAYSHLSVKSRPTFVNQT